MTDDAVPAARWHEVRRLFDEAVALPPAEREALVSSPSIDDAVRAELRSLLAHHTDETGGDPLLASPSAAALIEGVGRQGERFGPWEIVKPLGAGGMGDVFQARRADGSFEGLSAIKVLKRGMDSAAVLERFSHERQVLARLEHPHIARMMDAGLSADGLPYFVMEYVDGVPIDEAARDLAIDAKLRLVLQLADAVAYAHRQLLVHRDLKPGNVLVTPQGQVKLLDFGIAKAIDPLDGSGGDVTAGAHRAYTPNYASPEQVRGERVGTGTDIYSIGVLLYQLLTGVRPTGREATTPAESARSVLEEKPVRPSSLPGADGAKLRGDLDNILLKALEKEPDRRYETVDALAQDIRNYLAGFPVSARAASRGYVLSKFVRRHRGPVAASTLALLAILGGLAGTAWQAHRAELALEVAQRRLKDIRSLSRDMVVRHGDAVTHLPGGLKLKEQLLTDNLGYLDRLLAESGDDPAFKGEIAMAYARLADIQVDNNILSLQRDAAGSGNAQRALALFAESEAAATEYYFYRWWSRAHRSRAMALRAAGKLDAAIAELAASQAVLRRGLAKFPAQAQLLSELGSTYFLTGQMKDTVVFASQGRGDEALAAFEQAHAIYKQLVDERSKEVDTHANIFQLGTIEGARGLVYFKRGDLARAHAYLASALAYRERVLAMEPGDVAVRAGLVSEATNLGAVCLDEGDAACALEATGKAWAQIELNLKEDPQNADALRGRANTALHHGRALAARRQSEAALEVLRFSEEDLARRAAAPNAPAAVQTRLARTRMAQAGALWQLGRTMPATQAAQAARDGLMALVAKSPGDAGAWMWLGELAAIRAEAVPAQRAKWRAEARDAYAKSAAIKPLVAAHLATWQQLGA